MEEEGRHHKAGEGGGELTSEGSLESRTEQTTTSCARTSHHGSSTSVTSESMFFATSAGSCTEITDSMPTAAARREGEV